MRITLTLLMLLLAPLAADAQEFEYHIDWFFQGANSPFQEHNVMGNDSVCVDDSTLPSVPNNVVNPSTVFLQHDSDADGDLDGCQFAMNQIVGPVLAVGDYYGRAHVHRIDDPSLVSGGSADSNPFGVADDPADPAGLVIR